MWFASLICFFYAAQKFIHYFSFFSFNDFISCRLLMHKSTHKCQICKCDDDEKFIENYICMHINFFWQWQKLKKNIYACVRRLFRWIVVLLLHIMNEILFFDILLIISFRAFINIVMNKCINEYNEQNYDVLILWMAMNVFVRASNDIL